MRACRPIRKRSFRPAPRGGILLEVVLSISLFAGAAAFTLASVRSVFQTLERARLLQEAIDLARSKMSELEAGLITISDLPGSEFQQIGSFDRRKAETEVEFAWQFEVQSQRSEFTGLSLVELTVTQTGAVTQPMTYTLRQLVSLRDEDEAEFEEELKTREGSP